MKALGDQDHYEVLEIPRDTSIDEIERAYRLASAAWSQDSLAGYSLLDDGEVHALRDRVETAYRVLSDDDSRRAYDAWLRSATPEPAAAPEPEAEAAAPEPEPADVDALDDLDDEAGEFDGARLRRARLRRGIEIEDVSKVTKVNPTYLRFIEADNFDDLPARVYVRGFVAAYASFLGLAAEPVANSYMKHYEARRSGRRRGRFFGGEPE